MQLQILPKTKSNGNSKKSNQNDQIDFKKKDGIKYCSKCGKGHLDEILKCECLNEDFIPKGISEVIGGYLELSKNNNLRNYYLNIMSIKSSIKMNNKRIIHQLLIHKNPGSGIHKEMIDKIYNANITMEKKL